MPTNPERRRFVRLSALAAAACALGANAARAAGRVPLDDPQAQALGFTEASVTEGQRCANCMQFRGGAGDAAGPCLVFGGREVPAGGWCRAWTRRSG